MFPSPPLPAGSLFPVGAGPPLTAASGPSPVAVLGSRAPSGIPPGAGDSKGGGPGPPTAYEYKMTHTLDVPEDLKRLFAGLTKHYMQPIVDKNAQELREMETLLEAKGPRPVSPVGPAMFDVAPGSKKAVLYAFVNDLRDALGKDDSAMPLFWRFEIASPQDAVALRPLKGKSAAFFEDRFEEHWKCYVRIGTAAIDEALTVIRQHCGHGVNDAAANATLYQHITHKEGRSRFLNLVKTFVFDRDEAFRKTMPQTSTVLKLSALREDMIDWFVWNPF